MRTASAAAAESPDCWVDATTTTVAERNGSFLFGQRAAFAAQTGINQGQSKQTLPWREQALRALRSRNPDCSVALRRESLYPVELSDWKLSGDAAETTLALSSLRREESASRGQELLVVWIAVMTLSEALVE